MVRGGYGLSHAPISGFTQLPQPDFGATAGFAPTTPSTTANPTNVMRLGENLAGDDAVPPHTAVYGLAGTAGERPRLCNSLYYQQSFGGYAVSQNYHTPYVNNWNFTISWQAEQQHDDGSGVQRGDGHPPVHGAGDLNPKNSDLLSAQLAQNVNTTATIADPLGRKNPITGKALTVQNGTLGSPYLGFSSLYQWYDRRRNSIRHAGYVNVVHRAGRGLTFTANYTYAKSIDTASSAGGDKNVLTPVGGQVGGQVPFGGTRANDRSVSTFDQRHVIHGVGDLRSAVRQGASTLQPHVEAAGFRDRRMDDHGLVRMNSGFPYMVYLSDTNQLGDLTHSGAAGSERGVPLRESAVQPQLSDGHRMPAVPESVGVRASGAGRARHRAAHAGWRSWSVAAVRSTLSIQKSFRLGESGKRRLQFRVDALNVFNHPVFAVYPNNAGGADFMGAPSTADADDRRRTTRGRRPTASRCPADAGTPGNTIYNNIVNMVNAQKNADRCAAGGFLPHSAAGELLRQRGDRTTSPRCRGTSCTSCGRRTPPTSARCTTATRRATCSSA